MNSDVNVSDGILYGIEMRVISEERYYQTLTAKPTKPPMMATRVHTKLIHDSQNAADTRIEYKVRYE